MKHKMPGSFGQWYTGAEEYASDCVTPDGGIFHCVDVYETEEEWDSVKHKGEPCGWTYVADDDGVAELKEAFFIAEVFDTFGYTREEVEANRVQG